MVTGGSPCALHQQIGRHIARPHRQLLAAHEQYLLRNRPTPISAHCHRASSNAAGCCSILGWLKSTRCPSMVAKINRFSRFFQFTLALFVPPG
jgi:hypothetical protein